MWGRLLGTAVVLLLLVRCHRGAPPPQDTDALVAQVLPQLTHLDRALGDGAGERMQRIFPEGYVFTWALTGLAWVELGMALPEGDPLRQRALAQSTRALSATESEAGLGHFEQHLSPPGGVFYAGWVNHLRAGVLLITPQEQRSQQDLGALRSHCDAIAQAFDDTSWPFLPSYSGMAWPADNVVAVSSLTHCDALLEPALDGSPYRATQDRWLVKARDAAHKDTGVLSHAAFGDRRPRGSSLALMSRFLHEVDPEWGALHYQVLRDRLLVTRGGVPGVLEHLDGSTRGDIDSGPLPLGVGFAASAVTAGSATLYSDHRLAAALLGVGEVLAMPVPWMGTRRYVFGALPVGDAFAAWTRTARPWTRSPVAVTEPSPLPPWWWRLPWYGLAAAALLRLWVPAWRARRQRTS